MDYKRCRVCLVPGKDEALLSLFEGDGDKALFFEKCFGIGVRIKINAAIWDTGNISFTFIYS